MRHLSEYVGPVVAVLLAGLAVVWMLRTYQARHPLPTPAPPLNLAPSATGGR